MGHPPPTAVASVVCTLSCLEMAGIGLGCAFVQGTRFVRRGEDMPEPRIVIDPSTPATVESTLSTLLTSADGGDRQAADTLFAALYKELHRMARRELAQRGAG